MPRTSFDDANCAIAQSLDVLGDAWTMLIVRDAFFGVRRFADFQRQLGISKNVLSQRLQKLVDHEILERVDVGEHGERFEYVLTEKGEDLLPVLTTLREWGDRWVFGEGNEPLVVKDRATGRTLAPTVVRDADGKTLGRRDLRTEAGPGADARTRALFPDSAARRRRSRRRDEASRR